MVYSPQYCLLIFIDIDNFFIVIIFYLNNISQWYLDQQSQCYPNTNPIRCQVVESKRITDNEQTVMAPSAAPPKAHNPLCSEFATKMD